ncbi:MAG: isoprenylcysteine carboxylmethyltransferase family protein [Gemmatimonadetes bacterium]|nr:isoprenylcysteine carboxylmethyltransferase family protein [Gemmatimonadota bacterium]
MAKPPRLLPDGSPDHPDLPYKPPLAYLAAMLAGIMLHRAWPTHARPAGWYPVGVTLVAIGAALLVWAKVVFDRQRTPLEPWKATKAIVDEGPFARSRNPVYIGFAIIQVGLGVWTDKLAVVLLVVVPVLMTAALVVPREEAYLRRKFGAVYEDYCSRVRRWF